MGEMSISWDKVFCTCKHVQACNWYNTSRILNDFSGTDFL